MRVTDTGDTIDCYYVHYRLARRYSVARTGENTHKSCGNWKLMQYHSHTITFHIKLFLLRYVYRLDHYVTHHIVYSTIET